MNLFFLIAIPLAASLLSLAITKRTGILEAIAIVAASAEGVFALAAIHAVSIDRDVSFSSFFSLDALSAVVLFSVAAVACSTTFYAIGYLREEVKKGYIGFRRVKQLYCLFHFFVFAMYAAIASNHPIVMWIFIEATTLSTTFLISFYNKPSAIEAAWKYLLINSIGLLLGFFGTLLFFTGITHEGAGLVSWQTLFASAANIHPVIAQIAFIFIVVGYGTKVGLAPMHTWLPDAHSKAPSPVSALLSGALLNVAFLAVLKFKIIADAVVDPSFSRQLLLAFGILSLGIAAFIIFGQQKYKRLFAYSSIEHMGIIALGIGFGGAVASAAALLHMIYHSFAKSVLFFTAGNVFLKYSLTRIAHIRGLFSVAPLTATILFMGFLAITGVPPFGTFSTEFAILAVGITQHFWVSTLIILFLVLIFAGFLRHVVAMTFGDAPETIKKGELNLFTVVPLVIMTALLCTLSLHVPSPLHALLISASSTLR